AHKARSYASVVSRGGFEIVQLPSSKEIREAIGPGLQGMVLPGSVSMLRAGARKIYTSVVEPLAAHFGSRGRLIIVPDDVLAIVPFQMLPVSDDPSSYLVKSYTISYAPSATALRTLRRERTRLQPMELLALAPVCDEDLEATRPEVTKIAALFPGKATTRLAASATKRDLAPLSLADHRFVHFATHGLRDQRNENSSARALHGD